MLDIEDLYPYLIMSKGFLTSSLFYFAGVPPFEIATTFATFGGIEEALVRFICQAYLAPLTLLTTGLFLLLIHYPIARKIYLGWTVLAMIFSLTLGLQSVQLNF